MSKYARLTLARRVVIENMTLAGYTQIEIGLAIGVHQLTVSRDLARCGSGTYCAKRAHAHAVTRAAVPTIVPLLSRPYTAIKSQFSMSSRAIALVTGGHSQ